MHDVLFHGIAIAALLAANILLIALGFWTARLFSAAPETTEAGREERPNLHQELKGVALSLATLGERLVKLEVQIGQLREQGGSPGQPTVLARRTAADIQPPLGVGSVDDAQTGAEGRRAGA